MLLFPPYNIYQGGPASNRLVGSGYALLFALPNYAGVAVATLLVQWVGVLIVAAIAFFVLKDK